MSGDGTNPDGGAANSGQGGSGGTSSPLFTQEQANAFAAQAKRGAVASYFKELGFDKVPTNDELSKVFKDAGELAKLQQGQQGDVERLTNELNESKGYKERADSLEVTVNRQRIAADLQLPTRFWKFIDGTTDDEITESVKGLKKDLNLPDGDAGNGGGDGNQNQGGGNAGGQGQRMDPNPQQGSSNGGAPPAKTMAQGAEAYKARHGIKE